MGEPTERPDNYRVTVVGAGFMGAQIALQCGSHGIAVAMFDESAEAVNAARQAHADELERRQAAGDLDAGGRAAVVARVRYAVDLPDACRDTDVVIEAIPERLEAKQELFERLDGLCPPSTLLASNSSSLRMSAIEQRVRHKERCLNAHFYPPVWQRTMVELMRGSVTSPESLDTMHGLVRSIGLTPLIVNKESTGFIFNRVWRAVKKETMTLVDQGVASHEDVDRSWMIALHQSLGPFGLMDMIGLDVVLDVENAYHAESGDPADAPPALLLDKVEHGQLGVKTGRGFYSYPEPAYQRSGWLEGAD